MFGDINDGYQDDNPEAATGTIAEQSSGRGFLDIAGETLIRALDLRAAREQAERDESLFRSGATVYDPATRTFRAQTLAQPYALPGLAAGGGVSQLLVLGVLLVGGLWLARKVL